MKYFLPVILFCLLSPLVRAQQDPLYSQYFNNPMLINPAFAGNLERLYAGVAYRTQWAGINGGPLTFNLNSHMSLVDNRIGVGMLAVQDQIGDTKTTQYGGVFSYRIKLKKSTFSFGMQAGFTRFATDPNAVKIFNNPDPAFNQFTQTKFNTGAGLLLQSERFTLGLSVPRMLPSTVSQGAGQNIQVYRQNFYLYGSYIWHVNERIQFKPSTLLRATASTPISVDLNANFIINNLYTIGLFTRKLNAYGVLLQMVMSNCRLGYVFELPGRSSALNYTTHEISLSTSLSVLQSHDHSPNKF